MTVMKQVVICVSLFYVFLPRFNFQCKDCFMARAYKHCILTEFKMLFDHKLQSFRYNAKSICYKCKSIRRLNFKIMSLCGYICMHGLSSY